MRTEAKRKALLFIGLIGIVAIIMVVLTAHAAEVKVDNNLLVKENTALQGEIDTLDIKIKSANSVDHIENFASKTLGMVYPKEGECVYLSHQDAPKGNLAMTIKENAYN